MPLFALPLIGDLFNGLFNSKLGHYCLIALAILAAIGGGLLWFHLHNLQIARDATAAELAKEQAATAAEHQRREDALSWGQTWATDDIKNVRDLNAKIAVLTGKSTRESAANDASLCFDAAASARIGGVQRSADRPQASK